MLLTDISASPGIEHRYFNKAPHTTSDEIDDSPSERVTSQDNTTDSNSLSTSSSGGDHIQGTVLIFVVTDNEPTIYMMCKYIIRQQLCMKDCDRQKLSTGLRKTPYGHWPVIGITKGFGLVLALAKYGFGLSTVALVEATVLLRLFVCDPLGQLRWPRFNSLSYWGRRAQSPTNLGAM